MQRVAFHTLGCKLNFSESSTIARQFRDAGWDKVDFPGPADVYVVNTCSVTEQADKECRSIVNRAMNSNPDGMVIVVGCYAQLKPDEIASMPGVDLVLGAGEKFNVLNYLGNREKLEKGRVMACDIEEVHAFISSYSSGDRTRAFLKVQDGCDYSCTFCTIPLARGHSRSDTIENVVKQAEELVQKGVKEVVLTGVNLGDFGIRTESGRHDDRFIDLARAIDQVPGLNRIRISSIEPNLLTDEVIQLVSMSNSFLPHFHIPLQSGSDKVLRLMRRRYLRDLYRARVERIRELMPHAGIGVDVIVGFPGETEEDFLDTFKFLVDLDVTYFHVFTYSERANTPAIEMEGVVPMEVRKARNKMLRQLSLKKQHAFASKFAGTEWPVLFEEEKTGELMFGYTPHYIRVACAWNPALVNTIVTCRLGELQPEGYTFAQPLETVSV